MADQETSLLERMQAALVEAKDTIAAQEEYIVKLTSAPLGYATVLKTGNKSSVPRPTLRSDFKNGVKVRVKAEKLADYGLKYPAGEIKDLSGGQAMVRLVQGGKKTIKVEDLELQDQALQFVDTVTLSIEGKPSEVVHPLGMELEEGDGVVINTMFQSIVAKAPTSFYGATAVVKELLEEGYCLISEGDKSRTVFRGKAKDLEKGDNVVLDPGGSVIVKNNKQVSTEFTVQTQMNVSWDEIGGLSEVKRQMYEMVELPHSKPEIFAFYNKKPSKGALLFGPPGCG